LLGLDDFIVLVLDKLLYTASESQSRMNQIEEAYLWNVLLFDSLSYPDVRCNLHCLMLI